MWITVATIAVVVLGIGLYLIIGSMRNGATFREVLPPALLLMFGIALATGLLILEGKLFPFLVWHNANGVDDYLSIGLPSIISIAVCLGIAKIWGKLFGTAKAPTADQTDAGGTATGS